MPKFKIKAAPKCTVCGKSAYPAERVDIFGISVHKLCFNCTTCAKKLTLSDAAWNTDSKLLYCKTHFADQLRTNDGARFAQDAKNVAANMKDKMDKISPGSSRKAAIAMDQGGLLDEDLKAIREAGYDKELETQISRWIESVSGKRMKDRGDTFSASLSDGVILCHFMSEIHPGSIPKVQDSSQPFKQMENIKYFLTAVRNQFSLMENELFGTLDLREEANLNQVLDTFATIHRKCKENDDLAHFVADHPLTFADMSGAVASKRKELERKRQEKAHAKAEELMKKIKMEEQEKREKREKQKKQEEQEKREKREKQEKQERIEASKPKQANVANPPAPSVSAALAAPKTTKSSSANSPKLNPTGQWYMLIGEENHGPYTTDEMISWYADGAVAPECWVSVDGGDWKHAKDLLGGSKDSGGGMSSGTSSSSKKTSDSSGLNPSSQWYMLVGDENHGPFTTEEMSMWYSDGSIAPECWVSVDGGDWKQSRDLLSGKAGGAKGGNEAANTTNGGGTSSTLSNDQWFMLVGEEQHGPYMLAELQTWVAEGSVDGGTYVSNGGEWIMARDAK